MNILSELTSRMQLSNTNSLSNLVMDRKSTSNFWEMSNWITNFKYGLIGLVTFILFSGLIYLTIVFFPCSKFIALCSRENKNKITQDEIEMTTPLFSTHNHTSTHIDPVKGLCWNDGCIIVAPTAPTLIK